MLFGIEIDFSVFMIFVQLVVSHLELNCTQCIQGLPSEQNIYKM